jgi:hypothetical protein
MSLLDRMQTRAAADAPGRARPTDGDQNPGRMVDPATVGATVAAQPKTMQLKAFYESVLPAAGNYCLWQKVRGPQWHTWCPTIDALVAETERRIDTQGLYFGTAAFGDMVQENPEKPGYGERMRTQENVLSLKAFRVDIDAGTEKFVKHPEGAYPTQRDALTALIAAIKAGLPAPSLIVSSGEGLHVYWRLTEEVTPDVWKPAALRLNAAGAHLGLKIDAGCTADTARVLRPIGTPHKNGKRVAIIKDFHHTYSAQEFAGAITALAPEEQTFDFAPRRAPKDPGINGDVLHVKGPPASLARVAESCGAVAQLRDTKGNIPEPFWRAVMGVAKYCEDGEALVHEWSAGHPDYSAQETQGYLDRWHTPPTTCQHFSLMHSGCNTCQYRGKITTPKQVGYIAVAPAANDRTLVLQAEGAPPAVHGTGNVAATTRRANLHEALPDWKRTADGTKARPLDTTPNLAALAMLEGIDIRHNVMTRQTEITVPGLRSERDDFANAALTHLGDAAVRAGMSRGSIKELADACAGANPFHPVLQWITATPWDRISRRERFHSSIELKDPGHGALRAKLLDAWALQCIGALELTDGIAAQGILVLAGPQGTNKTRWCANLCLLPGAVRTGLHLNPQDKDSVFQATSSWISELGELDHTTRRADVSALKAFITRPEDTLRRPYALTDNTYRRRTNFVGTVNGAGFLADDTGDRRFWVLGVLRCNLLPAEEMQQIWAEYLDLYRAGQRWHLDAETQAALSDSNADHRLLDPLQERIQSLFEWSRSSAPNWHEAKDVRWRSATDVCLELGLLQPKRSDATRAGVIVRSLNGGIARRSNGLTLLAVPPRKGQV